MCLFSLNISKLSWRKRLKNYPGKLKGRKVRSEVIWKRRCMWQNVNDVRFCSTSSIDNSIEQFILLHMFISLKNFLTIFVGSYVFGGRCLTVFVVLITINVFLLTT